MIVHKIKRFSKLIHRINALSQTLQIFVTENHCLLFTPSMSKWEEASHDFYHILKKESRKKDKEKIIWKAKEIKMCLQCSTDAKLIIEDVIPGYSLYQAKKNAEGWPEEWYGLVKENDPTFVFPAFGLEPDLCDNLTEEQIDALPEDSKELESVKKFNKYVQAYKHLFETDPNSGWDFVESCMRDGYRPDIDGFVECWFLNKVAQSILGGRG